LSNLICAVSYWELKVNVALHFGKSSHWSNSNEKGIHSLFAWLIPTLGLPDLRKLVSMNEGFKLK